MHQKVLLNVRIDHSCIYIFLNNFNPQKKGWLSHRNYKTLPQKIRGIPAKLFCETFAEEKRNRSGFGVSRYRVEKTTFKVS